MIPEDPTHATPPQLPPTDRRALLAGLGGLAAGAFLAGSKTAHAGPLDPPAGPITSTGKTLTEVEPRIAINSTNTPGSSATSSVFRITQPGSYYLTGNIISTTVNRHVIVVAANGVTIDLNGFLIRGLGSLQGDFDCISGVPGIERVVIRNGHIELAGRDGVNFQDGRNVVIESVSAQSCLRIGITSGTDSMISHCTAVSNLGGGIFANPNTSVSGCTATFNSASGISTGSGCVITNSTASNNTLKGISALNSCIISHCSSTSNDLSGIDAGLGCTIFGCSAYQNTGRGISTVFGCTISGCTARLNSGIGLLADAGSTIAECTASNNTGSGIFAAPGSTIAGCTASENTGNGIEANNDCRVVGNTCDGNGTGGDGAGILVVGNDTRVEDNNCTDNDRGIEVNTSGNIILRNTCSGNTTNYVIAANNRYGPIINITATGTAAVSGNSAADTTGTTHPWANFAY